MTEMRIKQECEASARKARRMTPSVGASLTVEASFCVPVVFLAVYVFLQLFLFLRVQSEMQSAMSEVVREVSEYGTVYSKLSSLSEDDSDDLIAKLGIDKAIGRVASQAYMGYLLREKIRDVADLVPQFLPSVPVDPYDTAAEIKYDAKSGILWSVGEDRIFTGKEPPDPNDFRARDSVIKIDGE